MWTIGFIAGNRTSSVDELTMAAAARMEVIRGNFQHVDLLQWKRSLWKMLVFVSSTFTDTHRERDYLMKELHPRLMEAAREHRVLVTFVDMR
jgi:hypothetical protein